MKITSAALIEGILDRANKLRVMDALCDGTRKLTEEEIEKLLASDIADTVCCAHICAAVMNDVQES